MYLDFPSIGGLLGGPHISRSRGIEIETSRGKLESKESSIIGDSSYDSTKGSSHLHLLLILLQSPITNKVTYQDNSGDLS